MMCHQVQKILVFHCPDGTVDLVSVLEGFRAINFMIFLGGCATTQ